jgi:chromosome segregation ATPase
MKNSIKDFNKKLDADKDFLQSFKLYTANHSLKSSEWYDSVVDFARENGFSITKIELISYFEDEDNPKVKIEILENKLKEAESLKDRVASHLNQKIDELNKEIGQLRKNNTQLDESLKEKEKTFNELRSQVNNLSKSLESKTIEAKKSADELLKFQQQLNSKQKKGSCLLIVLILLIGSTIGFAYFTNAFWNELSGIKYENEQNKRYRYKYENQIQDLGRTIKRYENTVNEQRYTISNLQNQIYNLTSIENYEDN